jgi:hypothetical protein
MDVFETDEMVAHIISFLNVDPKPEIVVVATINKLFYKICNRESVWKNAGERNFGSDSIIYKPKNETYKQQYIKLYLFFKSEVVHLLGKLIFPEDRLKEISRVLDISIKDGLLDVLLSKQMLTLSYPIILSGDILADIAGHGHIHMLEYYEKQNRNNGIHSLPPPSAYCLAAANGEIEVMEWLYKRGVPIPDYDEEVMYGGVCCVFSDMIVYDKYHHGSTDATRIQRDSSYKLAIIIYQWLLDHSMPISEYMYSEAGHTGNIYMLDFLEEKGVPLNAVHVGMDLVCGGGHISSFEWFAKRGVLPTEQHTVECTNNVAALKWLVDHNIGPFREWIKYACTSGSLDVLEYLESIGMLPDRTDVKRLEHFIYSNRGGIGNMECSSHYMNNIKSLEWIAKRNIKPNLKF